MARSTQRIAAAVGVYVLLAIVVSCADDVPPSEREIATQPDAPASSESAVDATSGEVQASESDVERDVESDVEIGAPAPPETSEAREIEPPQEPERNEREVLFVHRVPGPDYGKLGVRHVNGTRTLLDITCERVHIAADQGACMSRDDSIIPFYSTIFFQLEGVGIKELGSNATTLPSRVRISPAGSWASTTSFVSGASYQDIGSGAEALVTMTNVASPDESFPLNNVRIEADSSYNGRRFWGVTFANEDEFFVTGLFGDEPEIMAGEIEARVVRPTGIAGSCPSLSPDGNTLIVKRQRTAGDGFELVAIDLQNDESRVLGESRSVDDQVEWLDNDTILYALHKDGLEDVLPPELDLWSLDIAPDSTPKLFLPSADSPAVLRDS